MKELVNKLISNLHFFIIAYGLYGAWLLFDTHTIRIEELNNQFPSVEAEIVSNQKKVKEIQEFVKKTEESKVRVEEVAKNIESAQKQLPAEINDNQILTFFNQEISSLNIKDPQIVPGRENTTTYFISKEYMVKAKGTFLQFLIFLERIGNSTRIYNVKSLKLVNADTNQRGRFQLISAEGTIEAFRFNPDFKVDRGFDKIETPPPGP
jgi:Tfp pilus assembly protein PilO